MVYIICKSRDQQESRQTVLPVSHCGEQAVQLIQRVTYHLGMCQLSLAPVRGGHGTNNIKGIIEPTISMFLPLKRGRVTNPHRHDPLPRDQITTMPSRQPLVKTGVWITNCSVYVSRLIRALQLSPTIASFTFPYWSHECLTSGMNIERCFKARHLSHILSSTRNLKICIIHLLPVLFIPQHYFLTYEGWLVDQ